MSDFYSKVPRTLAENLAYRFKLRTRAAADAGFRRACLAACKHDILWFFSAWCFLYEPRPKIINGKKQSQVIPFIPWPHQIPTIQALEQHLGFKDIGIEKSRGEGASWIAILRALRDWLFVDMTAIGFVSRNEKAVDNPDDPDSLFAKVDWELTKLPKWMTGQRDVDYKRNMADHTLKNLRNGSTITGYSATGDVASGGRKTWFLLDELSKFPRGPDREAMASTQHVTNSRLIISTPKGREGAYYDLMHDESGMEKLVLDWKDNRTRNPGLYRLEKGLPVAVDPQNNPLPKEYDPPSEAISRRWQRLQRHGFELDNRLRSPWYDNECDRPLATPQSIAQELDRDYGGSVHRVFREDFFKQAELHVQPPLLKGMLDYSGEDLQPHFQKVSDGLLHLWLKLDVNNRPAENVYVVGADPSFGLGGAFTNNSAAFVLEAGSMEQVAEFAVHTMPPEDFAEFCIVLCKWFHNARLIFEANGPGIGMAKRIMRRGYSNVHERIDELKRSKTKTRKIGWWSSPDTKKIIIGEFNKTVRNQELKLHSDLLVKECWQYVVINGEIQNETSANSSDDISQKHSHADRVIAAALALHGVRDRPVFKRTEDGGYPADRPPVGTLAWREKYHRDRTKDGDNPWDERTNDDLASGESVWQSSAEPIW